MTKQTIAALAAAALILPSAAWAQGKETAPGQVKADGEPAQGHAYGHDQQPAKPQREDGAGKSAEAPRGNAYGHAKQAEKAPRTKPAPRGNAYGHAKRAEKAPKAEKAPAPQSAAKSGNGKAHQKTTLCHATGSETNPYVTITVSDAALPKAHDVHQHDEDIIPAPAEGCPGPAAPAGETPGGDTEGGGTEGGETPGMQTPGSETSLTPDTSTPTGAVLGESAEGPEAIAEGDAAPADAVAGETADREAGTTVAGVRLPFTGLDAFVVAIAGLALLLAGVAGQRVMSRQGH